ncbi:MAG: hypothetical protein WD273_07370 [Trueperaceae bacterium]
MTSRPLFQAAVSELESVLAPRVVSRSLKEGLAHIGSNPEELDLPGLERILKNQVYRQLQVTMSTDQAKETISEMLGRLRTLDNSTSSRTPTPAPLDNQLAVLAQLRKSMRPFNLYFEWPEVQKLRAQIQLLDNEQREGREAGSLLREARDQLRIVVQKLEDQLVIQARELSELEEMIDGVRALGGPNLRRLENLLGQIRDAQQERQLATAEIERARRLGADLRKLLESSVLVRKEESTKVEGGILEVGDDDEQLAVVQDELEQDVNTRLRQIDLESELHELGSIESAHRHALEHLPDLRQKVDDLRRELAGGEPLAGRLSQLRDELETATDGLRRQLQEELDRITDDALRYRHRVDIAELNLAVQVTRGLLDSSLPTLHDMRRIRDLHEYVSQRAGEVEQHEAAAEDERQARLNEQATALAGLNASLRRNREDPGLASHVDALRDGLAALQAAHDQEELVPELLAAVRRSEDRLQAALGEAVAGGELQSQARARALLVEVESLPLLPAMRERTQALSGKIAVLSVSEMHSDLPPQAASQQVGECEVLLRALKLELRDAYSERLKAARLEADRLSEHAIALGIEQAQQEFAQGAYPSLHEIEGALRAAADRRRQEELAELRTLEIESQRFGGLGLAGYEELLELLELLEKATLETDHAPLLSRAWLQLEALRATVEQRLAGVERRLDAALVQLSSVEKLNSEDVEEVRRTLRHLDGQRASLGRVSMGLRLELESSLQHAEKLLAKLQQEYEATRAIANQLVSGNFIDDMLGLLGSGSEQLLIEGEAPAAASSRAFSGADYPTDDSTGKTMEATSDNPEHNALVDRYLAEDGVSAVALLDGQGNLVSGRLHSSLDTVGAALDEWLSRVVDLGAELNRGMPQLGTVELGHLALVTTRPMDGCRLLAVMESSAAMSRVVHQLRSELSPEKEMRSLGSPLT